MFSHSRLRPASRPCSSLNLQWLASRSPRAFHRGEGWSGRRGSNPRPTAWKAVTLPLSYSRLRARCLAASRSGGQARCALLRIHRLDAFFPSSFAFAIKIVSALRLASLAQGIRLGPRWLAMSEARRAESNGGEGRTRTFEAARATDLQSAAFDRFATSPNCLYVLKSERSAYPRDRRSFSSLELAKGFEPPTC